MSNKIRRPDALAESPNPDPSELLVSEPESAGAVPDISVETALQYLQKVRPADALGLLREPEAAMLTARAFLGFRVNAQGYAHPVVRARLAQELVRDAEFRRRLMPLVEAEAIPAVPAHTRAEHAVESETGDDALQEELQHERQRRTRERDEARAAIGKLREEADRARRELEIARRSLDTALRDRDSLHQSFDRMTHRVQREERRLIKLRSERDTLLKRLAELNREGASSSTVPLPAQVAPASDKTRSQGPPPFEEAARRLLEGGHEHTALEIANMVLKIEPRNVAALDIAATALRRAGKNDQAVSHLRDLALAAVDEARVGIAVDAVVRLLAIDPSTASLPAISKGLIQALKSAPAGAVESTAGTIARLRRMNEAGYTRLWQIVLDHGGPDLIRRLQGIDDTRGGDLLPLDLQPAISAPALISAIDRGDVVMVKAAREATERLRAADRASFEAAVAAVTSAGGGDDSYLEALLGRRRGDVLVDASNIAWYDEVSGVAERPRLSAILQVRSTLRRHGYFPVTLIGDAPLPYTIDDRDGLRRMVEKKEITLVDTGTDADEILIREARRRHAPIVTNDYMADWDPDDEVEKIRYALPPVGPAYLLPD